MSPHSISSSRPSLSSNGSSHSSGKPVPVEPVPYRPQRSGSVNSLQASMNSASSPRTALSRLSTSYSVNQIYGDMDSDEIERERSLHQNEILRTLSKRMSRVASIEGFRDPADEENQNKNDDVQRAYEKLPDTAVPARDYGGEFTDVDPELVAWDGPDDPAFPRNWSWSRKFFSTFMVSIYTLISPMSSSVLSPAMPAISEDINLNSTVLQAFSVSIMVLAWALGPLIIAPISESDRVGRRPVLNISIWITFVFNLACGFAKTTAQLCVFRFLGGLGGCAPLNVGAGCLADVWNDDQRLLAMAFYSMGPLLGPVIAPVISGFVVQRANWHWCFFYLAIFNFVVAVVGLFFFEETYSPTLLRKKAVKLRKETGNTHLHTIFEVADGEPMISKALVSVSRPITLLVGHPMVFGLGIFMAFCYGFMYLLIVTYPAVYKGSYGFSTEISGLMYIPLGIGFILGTIIFTPLNNWMYRKLIAQNNGVAKPEHRLPMLLGSGFGMPVALIWYGWSAEKELHWIMPAIGSVIFGIFTVPVFQNIQSYLIDMNNRFAASSVAAAAVFRSLFGFSFPLFASFMYDSLGYGWGNTMFAFIGLALGVPFPVFCLKYGERLRDWANAKFDRQQAKRDAKNLERLQAMEANKNEKRHQKESSSDSSTN
ncbi:hypothetical protein CXQ85_000365 [Candidozyma haemuli]|uniref:Major facilitator superfamily (MFS) profile domain-containing protein n=1 Tax=Candidozyma haemuli TaxID=45357 RepID=A0A2V1AU75_9ASCO|nr:hypothetical protein CXQ85_000365 [[Candida] haemuloni]PVH21388.1 hypothetical protein CXQ85_000365 [[Candida] haemuloni]